MAVVYLAATISLPRDNKTRKEEANMGKKKSDKYSQTMARESNKARQAPQNPKAGQNTYNQYY
jgi:hypothetical protein